MGGSSKGGKGRYRKREKGDGSTATSSTGSPTSKSSKASRPVRGKACETSLVHSYRRRATCLSRPNQPSGARAPAPSPCSTAPVEERR